MIITHLTNKFLILPNNIFLKYHNIKFYTNTVTEQLSTLKIENENNDNITTVTSSKQNNDSIEEQYENSKERNLENSIALENIVNDKSNNTAIPNDYDSIQEQYEKSKERNVENQAILEKIINANNTHSVNTQQSNIGFRDSNETVDYSEDHVRIKAMADAVQYPNMDIKMPHSTEEIEAAVAPIMVTCDLGGEVMAGVLERCGVILEESQEAIQRQESTAYNAKKYVDSFGIRGSVLKLALVVSVTYTVYTILRYRQIPLGGFVRGLVNSNIGTPPIVSNIINPTPHITINMPSSETLKTAANVVTPGVANSAADFINNLKPQTQFFLGAVVLGVAWILKKRV